jgi:L-serine deaminase
VSEFLHSVILFIDTGLRNVAVKAVTAAQLSMASTGVYRVTLDEAIEAMRLTAADMSVKYKETSLSVRH